MVCANDYDDYNPQHEDLAAVPEKIVPDKVNIEPDSPLIGTTLRLSFNLIGQLGGATVTDGSQKITADDL